VVIFVDVVELQLNDRDDRTMTILRALATNCLLKNYQKNIVLANTSGSASTFAFSLLNLII
jgi:hypothetical protein